MLRRTLLQHGLWAVMWSSWLDRRRGALLVGVNQTAGYPPLAGALLDVALQEHVLQRWQWSQRQTLANPTQATFLEAVADLSRYDPSFFHFSGYVDTEGLWLKDGRCPWSALQGFKLICIDGRPLPGQDWHQPFLPPLSPHPRGGAIIGYAPEQHQQGSLTPSLSLALWHGDPQLVFPYSQRLGSLSLPDLPLASAWAEGDQHIWLGGIPVVGVLLPGTRFVQLGQEEPLILVERQGWVGKVQGELNPAAPLIETQRLLPSKVPLKVGLGSRLERVERVDLTNALVNLPWLELGEGDCTLDRLPEQGYGLLNAFGDPWSSSLGGGEESLAQALQRLQPCLRQLQTWKKLRTLVNPAHPTLRLHVTLNRDSLSLRLECPPNWQGILLNWDPSGRLLLLSQVLSPRHSQTLPLPTLSGIHELLCLAGSLPAALLPPQDNRSSGWIPLTQPWEWLSKFQEACSQPGREPDTRRWDWQSCGVQSLRYRVS
ncbi:MAG: hypothetical protein Q6J68_02135 [Thermostichales cyanobacterium SZTDM-1c_bins_54]